MKTQTKLLTMFAVVLMAIANSSAVFADHDVMANYQRVDVGAGHPVTGHAMHYAYGIKDTAVKGFHITINVPVPSEVPGFDTLASALDSKMMVTLTRGRHVYAECTIQSSRSFGLFGSVSFELEVMKMNGMLKAKGGVCNVTPWAGEVTEGVPEMITEDMAKAYLLVAPDNMKMLTQGRAHPM